MEITSTELYVLYKVPIYVCTLFCVSNYAYGTYSKDHVSAQAASFSGPSAVNVAFF